MKERIPFLVVMALVLAAAGIIHFAFVQFEGSQAATRARLTTATNVQLDILAPFIQSKGLAHVPPGEADFADYLRDQITSGKITEADAKSVLEQIAKSGQHLPVFTRRGWEMPLIAKGAKPHE